MIMKLIFACSVIGLLYLLALKVEKIMRNVDKHEEIVKSEQEK